MKMYRDWRGVLSGTKKEVTIIVIILVARSKKRFTKCAENRAKVAKESAGYKHHLNR